MTTQPTNALSLIPKGLDEQTATAVQKFIPLLRELVNNGKRLSDEQIIGRAVFAAQQGLDPITEVHTILGKDGQTQTHTMAITGYRRKCQEQVGPGVDITLAFRQMAPEEIKPYGPVLVGYECTLRDGQSYREWQKRLIEVGRALREAMGQAVSYEDIIKTVGPAPVYTGVGFFYSSELSPDWKDKSFNPIERAKKRAEVNARGKRFPRNAPVYADGDVLNGVSPIGDAVEAHFVEPAPGLPEPKRSEVTNLADLGFAPVSYVPNVPNVTDVTDVTPPEPEPPQIEPDPDITDVLPVQRPYNLEQLKTALAEWSVNYANMEATTKHRQLLANAITTSLNGSDDARHDFDLHVFGVASLNDVDGKIILAALKTWYGLSGWNGVPDPMAIRETQMIYDEISVSNNQPKLFDLPEKA